MEQSPRKRVTRARAAAKAAESGSKGKKITAASSKSETISSKRKIRVEENLAEVEVVKKNAQETITSRPKMSRTRTRKAAEAESELEPELEPKPEIPGALNNKKPTRGRPRKIPVESNAPQPSRTLRGRLTKSNIEDKKQLTAQEKLPKRSRLQVTTLTNPVDHKKSVKFEEPDKENIIPISKQKNNPKDEEVHTGLRAKPVRKPATSRTTRGRKPVEEDLTKLSLLKPKKSIDTYSFKDYSDDELAMTVIKTSKSIKCSPENPVESASNVATSHDSISSTSENIPDSISVQDIKDSICSPARRPPQTPFRDGMKMAPLKMGIESSIHHQKSNISISNPNIDDKQKDFAPHPLLSPAKRPKSPVKLLSEDSQLKSVGKNLTSVTTPAATTFKISRFATPRSLLTNTSKKNNEILSLQPETLMHETQNASNMNSVDIVTPKPTSSFSRRLSSNISIDNDPTYEPDSESHEPDTTASLHQKQKPSLNFEANSNSISHNNNKTPKLYQNNLNLFPHNLNDYPSQDSDSEDELAFNQVTNQKTISSPEKISNATPMSKANFQYERNKNIGFTPLARQLSEWMASSPTKSDNKRNFSGETLSDLLKSDMAVSITLPSAQNSFLEEMKTHDQTNVPPTSALKSENILEVEFEPVEIDQQDLELALEANEMSLLDPCQIDTPDDMMSVSEDFDEDKNDHLSYATQPEAPKKIDHDYSEIIDDSLPEAYQDNGNHNNVIDPQLLALPAHDKEKNFTTPRRVLSRKVYHTVCKVPLKPAADETPVRPLYKKSVSSFRLPASRSSITYTDNFISNSLDQNAANYCVKSSQKNPVFGVPVTPLKQDLDWSSLETPTRTPRPDLNKSLLNGAVVYVDVYTAEGADASIIFTELLTLMGAKCVKSWNWNRNEDCKTGITHVVFKDGGKRTLEKVKECDGAVSCIGVGWVLDCERENKWMDETPYLVDTAIIPRGGARRRKSMEPRALVNLNGAMVPWSTSRKRCIGNDYSKNIYTSHETPMTSRLHRRQSVQWVHPQSNYDSAIENIDLPLSPLPRTPRPEEIYAYTEDQIYSETPSSQEPYFLQKEQLVQKTAPVKRYIDAEKNGNLVNSGNNVETSNDVKDQNFMIRLMAARRKSLQWAPKVGSPLAQML